MNNSSEKSSSEVSAIRTRAEELLGTKMQKTAAQLSEGDAQRLIHELEVHQIELELQNEELSLARSTAYSVAEKYKELYDFAPSGYFTLSREGEIMELNLSGASMLGKEKQKLLNSRFGLFISDETRAAFNIFFDAVFEHRTKESCEVALVINGNPRRYVLLTGGITDNKDQCLLNATDITARKLLEKNLVSSTALLNETQKMGKIGGWVLDLKTFAQTWTEETFNIFEIDLPPGESKTPEGAGFIAPEYRDMAENAIQRAMEFGEPYDQEWEIITTKGNRRWVHAVAKSNQENGRIISISGAFQDITERKHAEIALEKRTEELEQLNSFFVGRELKMVELKKEINELLKIQGSEEKYNTHS
jgi:PAS domain-containing protein